MNQPESRDLRELLDSAQLTALPQSAIRLIQLSQNPDKGPLEFAAPIESDPGLTVQVLRFVNSSYFGFRQEISSVKLAISLVGIRTIKNFALWSAVFSLMPNPKCGPFDLRRLWQDSLRRATFARILGKLLGSKESEDLFAAALLQDMAVPVLAKEMPECYRELLEARENGLHRLSDLEKDRFGWTHAQAGGLLSRRWGLPENFAAMIEVHSLPCGPQADNRVPSSSAVVALSALLPSVCDSTWRDEEAFRLLFANLASRANTAVGTIFERVDTEFTEFAPLLKLAAPVRSLVDSLGAQGQSSAEPTACAR